jgi:hypothetical protein
VCSNIRDVICVSKRRYYFGRLLCAMVSGQTLQMSAIFSLFQSAEYTIPLGCH